MFCYVEMYDLTLARCDAIPVTGFELTKIYLLGCSILRHVSLIGQASFHSEIHGDCIIVSPLDKPRCFWANNGAYV